MQASEDNCVTDYKNENFLRDLIRERSWERS